MRNRWLLALSVLFVFGLLASAPSQAQTNSCSASAIFGGCKVTCPADQRPSCTSYGLWATCTCEKWETSDPRRAKLSMDSSQAASLQGYIELTSSFESTAGKQVATAAINAYGALVDRNPVVYHVNVLAHNDAAKYLTLEEQAAVDAYVANLK